MSCVQLSDARFCVVCLLSCRPRKLELSGCQQDTVSKCSTATCAPATCTAGMRKLCMESSISGLSGAPTPFGVAFSSCAGRRLRVEAIATHMSLGSVWAKSSGAHGMRIRSSLCRAPIGSGRRRARTGRVVVSFFCNSPAGMCACAVQGTTLSVASHASTRNRCCCTFNPGKRLFFSVPLLTVSSLRRYLRVTHYAKLNNASMHLSTRRCSAHSSAGNCTLAPYHHPHTDPCHACRA